MKLKDTTKENAAIIETMEAMMNSHVKFWDTENKDTRFVHQISEDVEILSVSCEGNYVPDKVWKYGLKKIMKLNYNDVLFKRNPTGTVYLIKRDGQIH
ncbi:hypothetical protein [Oceanobacillus oncorhynchi]|uniref:hypothetical protein n=1 Tax=Oceanobacillus oncorhynchi TaxID=545501 RepID=UPI0034D61341